MWKAPVPLNRLSQVEIDQNRRQQEQDIDRTPVPVERQGSENEPEGCGGGEMVSGQNEESDEHDGQKEENEGIGVKQHATAPQRSLGSAG